MPTAGSEILTLTAIFAGYEHTCGRLANGAVVCWGVNGYGQLGDSTLQTRAQPTAVRELPGEVRTIATGWEHTCALLGEGSVKCWGRNDNGQLGNGTASLRNPTPGGVVGLGSNVTAITAGSQHTCALLSGGGVKCWGGNYAGQLGDGTTEERWTPTDVSGLSSGVEAIAAGAGHTCALVAGGGVKCWGENYDGRLGDGTTEDRWMPVDVSGLPGAVDSIAAGSGHTCARLADGQMACWGYNGVGQLGDGSWTNRRTPVYVTGLTSRVTAITLGTLHTCALLAEGVAKCWGRNLEGQLGDGTTEIRLTPVHVSGLSGNMTGIAAGGSHTCALLPGGRAMCWGDNMNGQLGDGTTRFRNIPLDTIDLNEAILSIAAGYQHTCALNSVGGLKCWGNNWEGQLGDGTMEQRNLPAPVDGLSGGVTAFAAGDFHTCALLAGGGVQCWGRNDFGQLGDGTTADHWAPVDVTGLPSGIEALTVGGQHTCVLLTGGGIKCWGLNSSGQLGDGTTEDHWTPVDVTGLSGGVLSVAAAGAHTCARLAGGGVKCWGDNASGQLGNGTTDNSSLPVEVSGLPSDVIQIATGYNHTCAIFPGGMRCWGQNGRGELGDGTTQDRWTPVDVINLASSPVNIAAGHAYTCVLLADAGVKCWGANWYGQLGNGTVDENHTPGEVSGLAAAAMHITAGDSHACALVGAGRSKCWGDDTAGQLGLGTITRRLTPVGVIAPAPSLTLNYFAARPGSLFTLTGLGFTPSSAAMLSINSHVLTSTLPVNPSGSFIIFLDTAGAEPGGYAVTVSGSAEATTAFFLADSAPVRPPEGGGLVLIVPAESALPHRLYVPLVNR